MLQHCCLMIFKQGLNVVGALVVEQIIEALVFGNLLKDLNRGGGAVGGWLCIGGVVEVFVQEVV